MLLGPVYGKTVMSGRSGIGPDPTLFTVKFVAALRMVRLGQAV